MECEETWAFVASNTETFPLETVESIIIDGANGISGAPRAHFPDAILALVLAVAAGAMSLGLLRLGRRGPVLALLLVAAVPGLWALVVRRADAPAKRSAAAVTIVSTLKELEARAPWPGVAVHVVREDDDVLFPLGRYALPGRPPSSGPSIEVELRGTLLGQGCREDISSHRVVCGAGE